MKEKLKLKECLGVGLLGSILLLILFAVIMFISGAMMIAFGMRYDSMWSVIKFFIVYFAISIVIESVIINSIVGLLKRTKLISDIQRNIIHFVLEVPMQIVIIGLVSSRVQGIYMPPISIIFFSIADFLVSKFLEKKADSIVIDTEEKDCDKE